MPVAAIVPEHVPQDFGEHPIGTGPWKLIEWKHDDYLLFARNDSYWGGAPKPIPYAPPHHAPGRAPPCVAEYEEGNVDHARDTAPLEAREWTERSGSKQSTLMSVPALALVYVGINTRRGPLADVRVRPAINYAIDVVRIIERLLVGRAEALRRHEVDFPYGACGIRFGASIPGWMLIYCPRQAAARPATPAASTSSSGVRPIRSTRGSPRPCRPILAPLAFAPRSCQREAAALRARGPKGDADMILKDWYADYPDAEDFLFPLLQAPAPARGGRHLVLRQPHLRLAHGMVSRLAGRARREQEECALSAGRLAGPPGCADGIPVFLQRSLRGPAVAHSLPAAGDLQRPTVVGCVDHPRQRSGRQAMTTRPHALDRQEGRDDRVHSAAGSPGDSNAFGVLVVAFLLLEVAPEW